MHPLHADNRAHPADPAEQAVRLDRYLTQFFIGIVIGMRMAHNGFAAAPEGAPGPVLIFMMYAALRDPRERLNHALSMGLGMTFGFFAYNSAYTLTQRYLPDASHPIPNPYRHSAKK